MKIEIKYMLITDLLGNKPNGRCPESFNSVEEATQYWRINYENRNKKDGHDEYWRKTPLRIQQIITTNLWEI
jgi:hypothetical protein